MDKQQQRLHASVIIGIALAALGLFALVNDGSAAVGVGLLAVGAAVIALGALSNRSARQEARLPE